MPYAPKNDKDVWTTVLAVMRWGARIPLAMLAIITAGLCAWTLFWLIYRAVEYLWETVLSRPW